MLKLRTKTEFAAKAKPPLRGVVNVIIRMIVDEVAINKNGITPKGYYYYYDENGQIVMLDPIGQKAYQSWDVVIQIENNQMVPALSSNVNLYDNVMQRLEEFSNLQQELEIGLNYGTTPEDWEADIDIS